LVSGLAPSERSQRGRRQEMITVCSHGWVSWAVCLCRSMRC
jgi:hypothetical protein